MLIISSFTTTVIFFILPAAIQVENLLEKWPILGSSDFLFLLKSGKLGYESAKLGIS